MLFGNTNSERKAWTIWEHEGEYWLIGPSGTVQGFPRSKAEAERACEKLNNKVDMQKIYEQEKSDETH